MVAYIAWDELEKISREGWKLGEMQVIPQGPRNSFPKSNILGLTGRSIGKQVYFDYEYSNVPSLAHLSQINPSRFARKKKFTEADAFIGIKSPVQDTSYNEKFQLILKKCRSHK